MDEEQAGEPVVKCPAEGCDHTGVSRGMHLHVRQSSGKGHGPHGDIPESIDMSDLEVVGTKDVEVNYPENRSQDKTARVCPWCERPFNGFQGLMIHLGQNVGKDEVHPDEVPEDATKDDFPVGRVDNNRNVLEILDEGTLMPSTKRRRRGVVDRAKVVDFIESLEEDGYDDIAEKAEMELL